MREPNPTPWHLGTDGNVYSGETNGELIASITHTAYSIRDDSSSKGANGRFIVKAVNNHHRLLFVCQSLIEGGWLPSLPAHIQRLIIDAVEEAKQPD